MPVAGSRRYGHTSGTDKREGLPRAARGMDNKEKEAEATLTDVACGPEHVGGRLRCRLFSTNRDFVEKRRHLVYLWSTDGCTL